MLALAVAPLTMAHGPSESVLIALISAASATVGGIVTVVGGHFKNKADKAATEADYAMRKMQAADEAFRELRETQQKQIDDLQTRLTQQWEEIVKLREEKSTYEFVRIALLEVMMSYPTPPGPPKISRTAAQAIGWEDKEHQVTPAKPADAPSK